MAASVGAIDPKRDAMARLWLRSERVEGLPERAEPAVVYADPWLLVVDKPSGLLSQSGLGPHLQDAVPGRLQAAWGELRLALWLRLHACGLAFVHPVGGERIALRSPPPWA
jgi:23S rRNA-/tRNA-specific pseudouridylate synthase